MTQLIIILAAAALLGSFFVVAFNSHRDGMSYEDWQKNKEKPLND